MLNHTCRQEDMRKPATSIPTPSLLCGVHISRIFIALKPLWVTCARTRKQHPIGILYYQAGYFTLQFHIHPTWLQGPKKHNHWSELINEQRQVSPEINSAHAEHQWPAETNHLIICRGAQVKCTLSSSTSGKHLKLDGTNPCLRVFKDPYGHWKQS